MQHENRRVTTIRYLNDNNGVGTPTGSSSRLKPRALCETLMALGYRGENGAPEENSNPDPQIRSLVLYPAELRARLAIQWMIKPITAIRQDMAALQAIAKGPP